MSKINVSPEEMVAIAGELDALIEQWHGAVGQIHTYVMEMDAMWDGISNDAFNTTFQGEDIPKLNQLASLMVEYSNAIKVIAQRYAETEETVRNIVKSC